MRSALTRIGAAVAVAAVLTGCSGGSGSDGGGDGDGTEKAGGVSAAAVCGGVFAGDAAATAALEGALGAERFEEGSPKPEEALGLLRDASRAPLADSYRPQPVKYCDLHAAGSVENDLSVRLAPAQGAPGLNAEHAKKVTSYASGLQAFSSSAVGYVYFSCGLTAPARKTVVEVKVWGPPGTPETDLKQRDRLMTLTNTAARKVSKELGCQGDGLATGELKTVPNPSPAS
ncbi:MULTISPECIES: hypothetical protein [unclassified Streptomyces]|uniref:hypothetical protein n=1 Tax=unclassified Streptomyces TaxID=2593676 RepID=UPI0007008708|nr:MULTISPECIES: hypothetical protein [unclassified Streptomyces]KQX52701.1 hypothetical protein ASD33_05335 [Streptomyces sp. Root1304]KRA89616.1 hypothetical protein ASE09_05340 [Streptomyces sp. Root66D1]